VLSIRFVITVGCVLISSYAFAQAPAAGAKPPVPMKNLQVLPKDMPQPQVVAIMRAFNFALGVECGHCHIWTKPGDPSNDMAADTKVTKDVSREMMRMTTDLNARLATAIKKPADQIARVECATCHRGAAVPVVPPPAGACPSASEAVTTIIPRALITDLHIMRVSCK